MKGCFTFGMMTIFWNCNVAVVKTINLNLSQEMLVICKTKIEEKDIVLSSSNY